MHKISFQFQSTGTKHDDEIGFFRFLVRQRFQEESNRAIQWCEFDGLSIVVTTLEPSIIDFVAHALRQPITTATGGYVYELI